MSSSKPKQPVHAPPLIIPPLRSHKTTLIILHGRGSTAQKFAEPLLKHTIPSSSDASSSSRTFQDCFPDTKFVFPTAPLRRAIIFKRSLTHQWFDNWSLTEPELKQHLQIPGLRETSAFLHDLLREEIKLVGGVTSNVAVMGLSQGCAASIVAALLWKGEPFGALVGMCGYLPFRKGMHEFAENISHDENDEAEEEDVFERQEGNSETETKFEKAVGWLREELQIIVDANEDDGLPVLRSMRVPVFMGHGSDDEKVPCAIGKLAADFLTSLDSHVLWKEYEGLGHWYSEHMLRDIVHYLKSLKGWTDDFESSDDSNLPNSSTESIE